MLLPVGNSDDIRLADYSGTRRVASLQHYIEHVTRDKALLRVGRGRNPAPEPDLRHAVQIRGQLPAKRAIQIAAAGGHNLLIM